MNILEKASKLAEGESLPIVLIREDEEKIKARLIQIKNNCNLVIRQLNERLRG